MREEPSPRAVVTLLAQASARVAWAVSALPPASRGEVVGLGADGEPTTRVDQVAEEAVFAVLRRSPWPLTVISEEAGRVELVPGEAPIEVLVDPVDATRNATYGLPYYATSLAAYRGGQALGAVLRDLASGECLTAISGLGAWQDGRPITVRDQPLGSGVVTFGPVAEELARRLLGELAVEAAGVRCFACPSLSLAQVATGRCLAFLGLGRVGKVHRFFDVAAAVQIVEAAGGVVTDMWGRKLEPELVDLSRGVTIVAAGADLHRSLLRRIEERLSELLA